MQYDAATLRRVTVRAKARKFAAYVKESNMACAIPEDVVDFLKDGEIALFFECLDQFGLTRRKDYLWERK